MQLPERAESISVNENDAVFIGSEVKQQCGCLAQKVEIGKTVIGLLNPSAFRTDFFHISHISHFSGKIFSCTSFISNSFGLANAPRIQQQFRAIQHIPGKFFSIFPLQNVAILVSDVPACNIL